MPKLESTDPSREPLTPAPADATPAPTPSEPWTPARVLAWNRYLDRFVAGGVLLLVTLAAVHPIVHSTIWTHLRTGQLISSQGPVTTDPYSFTQGGQRWVNIPWLFQTVNWLLYSAGRSLFSADPARADQVAASALIGFNALIVLGMGLLLLGIRHAGPGLWWSAVCLLIGFGGMLIPSGSAGLLPSIGGIGSRLSVEPATWGLFFLALELFLLHRALNRGALKALYALPAVFLLWVNSDESFLFGLIVLALWLIGSVVGGKRGVSSSAPTRPSLPLALGVVGACVVACLLNPSLHHAFGLAAGQYTDLVHTLTGTRTTPLTQDRLAFFDRESQEHFDRLSGAGTARLQIAYYLGVVVAGLASFALNRQRLSLGRLLAFLFAAVVWAGQISMAPFFAAVFVAVVALNGQEWYQSVFGREGQVGSGWKLFSDGGRAVTIIATFLLLAMTITGYASSPGEVPFGFGVDDSRFAFEVGDYLKESGIQGNVMNLMLSQGDAVIWRDPSRKVFIDGRKGVYPDALKLQLRDLRTALRKDDRAAWSKILDEYKVSALMMSPGDEPGLYQALANSPQYFLPIYDDGRSVVFGRVDRQDADSALFRAQRLDADRLVYKDSKVVPEPVRPPTATGAMDQVLRTRALQEADPHGAAAGRWLAQSQTGQTIDLAKCYMAIREARRALARNPDDSTAFRLLQAAYSQLAQGEGLILDQAVLGQTPTQGQLSFRSPLTQEAFRMQSPPTPPQTVPDAFQRNAQEFLADLQSDAAAALIQAPQRSAIQYDSFRFRQRLTALNFAIRTSPPPRTTQEKQELASLNYQLANLYLGNQALDLARDRLKAVRELVGPADFPENMQQQLDQLNEQVEQFQSRLEDLSTSQPVGPIEKANAAAQSGFLGLAIDQLLAAESAGISQAQVRAFLIDLYCRVGQPDEAFNMMESTQPNDPSLATGPGTAAYRQGLTYMLLGYYSNAVYHWQLYALPQLRSNETLQALDTVRGLMEGGGTQAERGILELTGTPASPGLIENQANWEIELAFCQLEQGVPIDVKDDKGIVLQQGAASHFQAALRLDPTHPLRPLIAFYLEKLGAEVPAEASGAAQPDAGTPTPAPTSPAAAATPAPEAPAATAAPAAATPAPETTTPTPAPETATPAAPAPAGPAGETPARPE